MDDLIKTCAICETEKAEETTLTDETEKSYLKDPDGRCVCWRCSEMMWDFEGATI